MFFILLYVESDGPCDLHFCQQVKVSQDKEHFALAFIERTHVLLVCKQVIIHIWVFVCQVHTVLVIVQDLIPSELTISKREYVIATLDHEHGEVKLSQLKIDVLNLSFVIATLVCCPLIASFVYLLSCGSLINGDLEFCCGLHLMS